MPPITLTRTATSTIITTTTTTKTVAKLKESQKLFTHHMRHAENKPLRREILFWSQCSQPTASPAQKTGKTKSGIRESQPK